MPEKFFDWLPTKPALTPKRMITASPNYAIKLKIQSGQSSLPRPFEKPEKQKKLIILPSHLKQMKQPIQKQNPFQLDLDNQLEQLKILVNAQPGSISQQKQQKLITCEQLNLALETFINILPETQSIIELLKDGIDQFKPQIEVHDQEIQEMLKQKKEQDSQIGINLSGLARVIVKKKRELQAFKTRKSDLDNQTQDLKLIQMVNVENEKTLNADIQKYEMLIEAKKAIKV
ncbi:hypothetical protein SS50377_24468 [Spironucleus salmonicida]|uniref:Uncharacterized protein n=1 Tax=Spironucleus salmonicida TaxID=348837 RepID=V6LYT0_9EUKA|nr:hypothetical protein SS50377_24468 [Spironucleus salmonicida]|eukprot:EST45984.1 Hypothetical protein SS50377_13966 [Spironucleus salmonicida]